MSTKRVTSFLAVVVSLALLGNPARACTWAAFAKGKAAIVARTFDWTDDDDAVVKGHGRNATVAAADTPNALVYTAKYASIQIHSFASGIVSEAMNEKGLQGSILFLDGSRLPEPQPGRKDVDPRNFVAYAVSSFATVREIIDNLPAINLIPARLDIPGVPAEYAPEAWPCHYAFADATGDRVVIEFIQGEMKVYHGEEHSALSNEPAYEIHLTLDAIGYRPNGTISTVDRRARARDYMRDMHARGVETPERALLAMRGLLATVLAGTEEVDPYDNEAYPTLWTVLADQNRGTYYMSRLGSWCSEIYDFSMFAHEEAKVVTLKAADRPYTNTGARETARPAAGGDDTPPRVPEPPKAESAAAATTEVLLKTAASWDGVIYGSYPAGEPELTLARIVIPANSALDWHTHPMPNAGYIVRGELTVVQHSTGLSKKLIGGQTIPEMVNTVHRGFTGSDPVELLVFYAGASGMPLSEPAGVE